MRYDPAIIPDGWRVIDITTEGRIFDWLKIIEGAEAVIMTDSVMANQWMACSSKVRNATSSPNITYSYQPLS